MPVQSKKAIITVYLSLVLGVMLSLILTLIEGARMSAVRMQIECVSEMGMNSAFAEFNRELLAQYDLFFIDTSYGTSYADYAKTEKHIKDYMSYNYQPNKGFIENRAKDLLALEVVGVAIEEASIATDENGGVLKRQAINYMKDKVGVDFVEQIVSQSTTLKEKELESQDIYSENKEVDNKLNNLEKEKDGEMKKVHLDSPANEVNASKSSGILSLVIDDIGSISTQGIQCREYVSYRHCKEGAGIPEGKELQGNGTEEILFGEYLLEKCGDYTEQKSNSLLQYQLEYLLVGKSSDKENLSSMANKLVLVRQVANSLYLWSDGAKTAEADAAAAAIAGAVLMPEIQPVVKASLMFAWAYAESVGDVKILLNGGKVPMLKNSSSWRLQFKNLANYRDELSKESENTEGLSYRGYLRLFLLSMNRDTKINRFMDIIEMDIRKTEGNTRFQLDNCIDNILVLIDNSSKFGYRYQIKRPYCYE